MENAVASFDLRSADGGTEETNVRVVVFVDEVWFLNEKDEVLAIVEVTTKTGQQELWTYMTQAHKGLEDFETMVVSTEQGSVYK